MGTRLREVRDIFSSTKIWNRTQHDLHLSISHAPTTAEKYKETIRPLECDKIYYKEYREMEKYNPYRRVEISVSAGDKKALINVRQLKKNYEIIIEMGADGNLQVTETKKRTEKGKDYLRQVPLRIKRRIFLLLNMLDSQIFDHQ